MRYKRLAISILVAGLGFVSGCRSNSCEGGLMSRFGFSRPRSTPVYDGNVIGTPVSGSPYGGMEWGGGSPYGGSYDGPALGDPTYMGSPTTIMPNMTTIPSATLPPPMAGTEGLRPVPGTFVPGAATPIPAGPSSRLRN